jgi:uncharacterized membrane protein YqjE
MFIGMIASTVVAISISNMKKYDKTPEEKRKDSIKGLIFASIIIISIHLTNTSHVPQKVEGAAVEFIVDTLQLQNRLITFMCVIWIIISLFCLWKYRKLGKEPENEEQEKKK